MTLLAPNPGGLRHRIHDHPEHRRFLLVTCLVGMFATTFPVTILAVSLKRIADDLGTTPSTIAWATTAPMLAAAVATPILGRVGDQRGHRRLFLVGFAVSIVLAALTSVAWNAGTLITFRSIGQLAGTATVPASLAMLFSAFPSGDRVRVSAWSSSVLAAAAVSGLVVGGPLTEAFGWRLIFVLQGGLSVVALLAALVVMRPRDDQRLEASIDWPGAAALAVTAFSLTFAVNRLPIWGPTPMVLALLVIFPVALVLFVRIERRTEHPILPLELIGRSQVRLAVITTFVLGAAWSGVFLVTPILMQTVLGLSVSQSSLASFPRATFISLAGPVSVRMGLRFGERRVAVVALLAMAGTMLVLCAGATTGSIAVIIVGIAAGGWCFGHVSPALMSMVSGAVDEGDLGVATSLQQTANQIGGVFGAGLLSAIAADAHTAPAFVLSFVIAAGLAVVGALVVTRARETDVVVAAITPGDDELMDATPLAAEQILHRTPADGYASIRARHAPTRLPAPGSAGAPVCPRPS